MVGKGEILRLDQAWRGAQQRIALGDRIARAAQAAGGQVAQATVHQL